MVMEVSLTGAIENFALNRLKFRHLITHFFFLMKSSSSSSSEDEVFLVYHGELVLSKLYPFRSKKVFLVSPCREEGDVGGEESGVFSMEMEDGFSDSLKVFTLVRSCENLTVLEGDGSDLDLIKDGNFKDDFFLIILVGEVIAC